MTGYCRVWALAATMETGADVVWLATFSTPPHVGAFVCSFIRCSTESDVPTGRPTNYHRDYRFGLGARKLAACLVGCLSVCLANWLAGLLSHLCLCLSDPLAVWFVE